MRCAGCGRDLVAEKFCASCPECGGVWFTAEQVFDYFEVPYSWARPSLDATTPEGGDELVESTGGRACPVCQGSMIHVEVDGALRLDRCKECKGLFFDEGESLALRSRLARGASAPWLRRVFHRVLHQLLEGLPRSPYR